MGLLDGFPFKSREQREREERKFKKRVTPFGEEGKQRALEAIRQFTSPKLDDTERLWAYFTAKDKYETMLEEQEDEEHDEVKILKKAFLAMGSNRRMNDDSKLGVLALVELEHGLAEGDAYPTRDVILTRADELGKIL